MSWPVGMSGAVATLCLIVFHIYFLNASKEHKCNNKMLVTKKKKKNATKAYRILKSDRKNTRVSCRATKIPITLLHMFVLQVIMRKDPCHLK